MKDTFDFEKQKIQQSQIDHVEIKYNNSINNNNLDNMTKNIDANIILNNTLINNYESATTKELPIQLDKMDNKSSLDTNGFLKDSQRIKISSNTT